MEEKPRFRVVALVAALALVLVSVLVGVVGLSTSRAGSPPNLPEVSAPELVASSLLAIADRTPISGWVQTKVDLGLPDIPASLGGGGVGPLDVFLRDNTFRVWRSADGSRIAQILPTSERDVVTTRTDVWLWDSDRFTAWHATAPRPGQAPALPSLGDLTSMVGQVLRTAGPYATVSTGVPVVVAGRDAYTVVLTPTDPTTLVGNVDVAIDAETRLPLRMQVIPKGSVDPALEAAFTSVDFGPIDPSMFAFTPPSGATVKELGSTPRHGPSDTSPPRPEVRTFGQGFGTIVAVRVRAERVPQEAGAFLPYAGPLGSIDLVERGDHAWIVGGAVAPRTLAAVEPGLP